MNYQDCKKEIDGFIGRGIHRGLDRMHAALDLLGHPEKAYPTVHIAGTNGKGSTAYLISNILKKSHYKVGLTLSPHIETVRERIQINHAFIPESDFVALHQQLKAKLKGLPFTYYEWIILMAFVYFAESRVDMAVLETGMGGRWDATNVTTPLVGVLTNVGLDHQQFLGATLKEILIEKMQILKTGMTAVAGLDQPELVAVLEDHCLQKKIKLHFIDPQKKVECGLKGDHQQHNARLALKTCEALTQKGFRIESEALQAGLQQSFWPARLETVSDQPEVLLDAAHNLEGIEALVAYLKQTSKHYHIVFGVLSDRPYQSMLTQLLPYAKSIKWALFDEPRAVGSELIKKTISLIDPKPQIGMMKTTVEDWKNFLNSVEKDDRILVTGCLHFVSQIRGFLKKHED